MARQQVEKKFLNFIMQIYSVTNLMEAKMSPRGMKT